MPGGEAAVAELSRTIPAAAGADNGPAIEENFEAEWRDVLLAIGEKNLRRDIADRHSSEPFDAVLKLAAEYPDSVSLSEAPTGRRHDMAEHVLTDIETLLDKDQFGIRFIKPVPDTEALLKIFEVGYIYDSVYRFCPEFIASPGRDGLEEIRFRELPHELDTWMGRVDVLWRIAGGDMPTPEDKDLNEVIDELYDERLDFIASAREKEMFLPIAPPDDEADDSERLKSKIEKRLRRNSSVPADLIFRYCYNRVIDY